MSGENDQTKTEQTEQLENESQQQSNEDSQDKENMAKAVKSSKDFDELIDKEGVDDNPSDESVSTSEDDKNKQKPEPKEKTGDADDKDSGKTEKDKGAQTQEDAYKVSEELAKKAIDLGLNEEEVAAFDSDEELQKTLSIIESISNEPEGQEQQTAQSVAKPDEKTETDDSVLKFENEEDVDPELLKAMKNMEKTYKSQISKLEQTVNAMQQQTQKAQQDQFIKRFDSMIDKLGLDFADVFGKGSTDDLSKRSIAFKNRDAIRARMYAFGKGFVEAKEPMPDEQQLFDLAVRSLHGKKIEDVKNAKASKKYKEYAKGARAGRPSSKSAGNLTPHQKAVETSNKFDALIDTSED